MQIRKPNIPDSPAKYTTLGQTNFSRGVISVVDQSNLPKNALKEADNITLVENGAPAPRPGVGYYGSDLGGVIDGYEDHVMPDDSVHMLAVVNGVVKRSTDDGVTWDDCSGATLTSGKKVTFEQFNAVTFISNAYDYPVRYDGTTTLQTYTALTTPTGGSSTKTGLTGTTYTQRYRVAALNSVGSTIASTAATVTVGLQRDSFDSSNYVTFTWTAVTGATRYDIYTGETAGNEQYISSNDGQANTTFIDKGQFLEQPLVAPESDTTGGPRVGDSTMVGTRLYAVEDRDKPYRIWISGAGRFAGQFGSAYDATYLDWQEGGKFKPVKVLDYRDGKGTPLATIYCKSKDGLGCVLQGTLELFTVGDVSFPVPNFYKLPGSRGTDAPFGVVEVLNDHMYPNSQAIFNLGSRAQFLNLLSTDEASANIRPDVQKITQGYSYKIAAHFQDAKVYFSMPTSGATSNNVTAVYDTERKAWMPRAFTLGFERFSPHTTSTGKRKLLCWKPGDTRLSEISSNLDSDYGVSFATSLTTGLQHVNPSNRFEFLWCEEGEVEFAQPNGEIIIELSGIVRDEGFKLIDTQTIEPSGMAYSWNSFAWNTTPWNDTETVTSSYSEPSVKRYFNVQQAINAYQYRVTTDSVSAKYILRTLQINGTADQAGKDPDWELF